jgi:hypothetical protein
MFGSSEANMDDDIEIIALVLDTAAARLPGARAQGAQRLIRSRDGRMSLEAIESDEEFERTARTTGCFRRGKAIRDPETREVIGYEMEEVSFLHAAAPM